MPAISIIVPVYNVEKYLADCLDSLLNQSLKDIEIICINDGSTDASAQILASYKAQNPDIIAVIEQENRGLSVARNEGLSAAKGEYVCFLDSDDMMADGALETLYNHVKANTKIQIINYETAPLLFEDGQEDTAKAKYYTISNQYTGIRPGADFLVEMLENNDYIESANLLFINRKWLLENKITFEPFALYEDSIFSIECFLKCQYMMHLSMGAYIYRIRANSIMTSAYTFEQAKWRIWQFTEVIRHIFQWTQNEREINALSKYAKMVVANINKNYWSLNRDDQIKIAGLESIYGLFTNCMGLNVSKSLNADLNLEGLMRLIEKSNRILLYGAGKVGTKIYELLKINGLDNRIVGFAVSDTIIHYKMFDNIYVRNIADYSPHTIDLLILSAAGCHSEMLKTAQEIGYKNIRAINYQMEQMIDKQLLENI